VAVPVIFLGEGLVEAVIEVFVVRKDDMTADIVELAGKRGVLGTRYVKGSRERAEALRYNVRSPPG
jgi:hypothetical protein